MRQPHPKIFNISGVCVPSEHYMLPVLPRIPDIGDMIEGKFYFVLHAPRQSGKTTFLEALTDKINCEGNYYAFNCSLTALRGISDRSEAINAIADIINDEIGQSNVPSLKLLAYPDEAIPYSGATVKIKKFLNYLCINLDKELVVFFDEADCLTGPALITFLAQIRDGYLTRHLSAKTKFPRSMALVGMRDIRDYLAQVRPDGQSTGLASPFNVKQEAFTLPDFTRDEIKSLYGQHTEATGQVFTEDSIDAAWRWSTGQPWLVNALANQVIVRTLKNDYSVVIGEALINEAAEALIQRRDTHIDSLLERLKEPRVRRVIEPIVLGDEGWEDAVADDDIRYAKDLGLIKHEDGEAQPANPIYGEAIVRTLTRRLQDRLPKDLANRWMDGRKLDMTGLLKSFQQFWRENSEMLEPPYDYKESTPHLVCFAYLRRVLNGGVEALRREYALGRQRLDLEARYKGASYPVELKIKRPGRSLDAKKALEQMSGYMEKLGALEGWLVVFDRGPEKNWDEKIYWETMQIGQLTIHLVSC